MSDTPDSSAKIPPKTSKSQSPKISKGAGCLTIIILCFVIGWFAHMAGCGPEGTYRVGPSGATAYPSISALGSSIRLEPGTKVQPIEKVSDSSWRYEVKEGQYEGDYVVISDDEVEFK
jgi:hypothetical protein